MSLMRNPNASGANKPPTLALMSAPRARHMKATAQIDHFLRWVVTSVIELDYAVTEIAKSEVRSGRADRSHVKRELAVGAGASRKLRVFYRLITEMTLCRAVDSYLTYLTELLWLIFRARPESLRSAQQVRLDFVLAHATRAGLLKAIIDREVNRLSYQGMRDLADFLSTNLGFDLFDEYGSMEQAILVVEIRNIIVHARGTVNETFIQRVSKPPVSSGKRIRLSINDVQEHIRFLAGAVAAAERRAHEKFGIKLPYRVPKPPASTSK